MLSNKSLTLQGYAYLREMFTHQDKPHITINLTNKLSDDCELREEIWLECEVDDAVFNYLAELEFHFAKEKIILISFEAEYTCFRQCFHGLDGDPKLIIWLQGKLLKIHSYYALPGALSHVRPIKEVF